MNSHERTSPHGRRYQASKMQSKPHVDEDTLKSGQVQIERKTFVFSLRENPRGRLLRITEGNGSTHSSIIIPAPGLLEFKKLLDVMIKEAENLPLPTSP